MTVEISEQKDQEAVVDGKSVIGRGKMKGYVEDKMNLRNGE